MSPDERMRLSWALAAVGEALNLDPAQRLTLRDRASSLRALDTWVGQLPADEAAAARAAIKQHLAGR